MKKRGNNLSIGLGVALFILVMVLVYTIYQYSSLKDEFSLYKDDAESQISSQKSSISSMQSNISAMQSSISSLEQQNNDIKAELGSVTDSYHDLNASYKDLGNKYSSLDFDYSVLKSETDKTINEIEDYKSEIQSSMSWFKQNSEIDILRDSEVIKNRLYTDCIKKEFKVCYIKTGCQFLVNKEYLGLSYKFDTETTSSLDKLQDLSSFYSNEGGDCEDYALFYKAEWNYMLDECSKYTDDIVIDSWIPSQDSFKSYFVNYPETWYLKGAEGTSFDEYIYPNIVCGALLDPVSGSINGHCMIALTKAKVVDIEDLDLLEKAPLIEPQNGQFLGFIGDSSSDVILLKEKDDREHYSSYILQVITDTDHFLFSKEYDIWQSYSEFNEELSNQQVKLRKLI